MLALDLALTTPYRSMQCLRKNLKVLVNVRINLTFSYTLSILILSDIRETVLRTSIYYCRHPESARMVMIPTEVHRTALCVYVFLIILCSHVKCEMKTQMSWGDAIVI